jgi:hypothetical protein
MRAAAASPLFAQEGASESIVPQSKQDYKGFMEIYIIIYIIF